MSHIKETIQEYVTVTEHAAAESKEKVLKTLDELKFKASQATQTGANYISSNPWKSVALSAAVGVIISQVIRLVKA